MTSRSVPRFKTCIPIIHITPSDDGASDHSMPSDTSDEEHAFDNRNNHKQDYVRPSFRPSRPNRSKSAPLPSDDEDSSEDDNRVVQSYQGESSPCHQHSTQVLSRNVPPRQSQQQHHREIPSDSRTKTPIPRRQHRPIAPPLTHVQSSQSFAYFVYPAGRLAISPNCSIYSQHRKAAEKLGCTFRRT